MRKLATHPRTRQNKIIHNKNLDLSYYTKEDIWLRTAISRNKEDIYEVLLNAIEEMPEKYSLQLLQFIKTNNIKFNEPDDSHAPVILNALQKGYVDLVLQMIRYIPNITEIKDINGNCLIHHAVANNNSKITRTLIDQHVNLNSPNSAKLSPLSIAIESKNIELAELLINSGARVNSTHDKSPLLIASQINYAENLVSLLICNGAIVNQKNSKGLSPLKVAAEFENQESYNIIKSFIDICQICCYEKENMANYIQLIHLAKQIPSSASLNGKIILKNNIVTTPTQICRKKNKTEFLSILINSKNT